ncbi:SDR family oxidoreductase [Paenibacillus sp. J5C_2022]|uniref:SDR family oxidoreductase n=1 Tax=Paenibacillus sp. J5C2022 TaxID=2977129 RepID=UPI0021D00D59|nr:SDR family oxidoreductase [Paenibacillus sp. J5C2022]MCU6709902.1 SDR family oxidoreductase [Paenibacillus sp. J5C2022]
MSDKVALLTGTSSGFGMLASLRFLEKGYRVVATMRDLNKKSELLERARGLGCESRLDCMKLDVTSEADIRHAMEQVREKYGRVDVLVNNAGYAVGGAAEEVPMEEWRKLMDTNLFGVIAMTQSVLPLMREQGSGTIINVSSVSGRIGIPGYSPYCTSKFALEGFSESLRHEVSGFGIKTVLICPGAYNTSIWDKGFDHIHVTEASPYRPLLDAVLGYSRRTAESAPDPDEIARKIVWLAGKKSPSLRYTYGKGSLQSMLGKSLLPWRWFERILAVALKKSDTGK